MTTYDVVVTVILAVGMIASGSFLWRFRPSKHGRFDRNVLPLWVQTASVFALYAFVACRMALGLAEQPKTFAAAVGGTIVGAFVTTGQILWALMYERQVTAAAERRRGNRRATDIVSAATEEEALNLLRAAVTELRQNTGETLRDLADRLEAAVKRMEANDAVQAQALHHLVDTVDAVRVMVNSVKAEEARVAENLEVAQRAVDEVATKLAQAQGAVDGVATELSKSQARADAVPNNRHTTVGEASDAAARSGES